MLRVFFFQKNILTISKNNVLLLGERQKKKKTVPYVALQRYVDYTIYVRFTLWGADRTPVNCYRTGRKLGQTG